MSLFCKCSKMHKIRFIIFNHLKVYNSVTFSMFTVCLIITTILFQKIFITPKGNTVPAKQSLPIIPSPAAPDNHQHAFCLSWFS